MDDKTSVSMLDCPSSGPCLLYADFKSSDHPCIRDTPDLCFFLRGNQRQIFTATYRLESVLSICKGCVLLVRSQLSESRPVEACPLCVEGLTWWEADD